MNPVMSDLAIFIRNHEIESDTRARRRAALVRPASGHGWFQRMVDGLHEFVDPRGLALARLRKAEAVVASGLPALNGVPGLANEAAVPTMVALVCDGREPECEERLAA